MFRRKKKESPEEKKSLDEKTMFRMKRNKQEDKSRSATGVSSLLATIIPDTSSKDNPEKNNETNRKKEVKYLESIIKECQKVLYKDKYVELSGLEYESVESVESSEFITGIGQVTMHIPMLYQKEYIEQETAQATDNICECILDNSKTVLLGEPGCGKTTALLQITLDYAQKAIADESYRIPIFVPLGSYKENISFSAFIAKNMPFISDIYFDSLFTSDRLYFLFDALNETIYEKKPIVIECIRKLQNFIVSCRTLDYEQDLQGISGLTTVKILDLDPIRIRKALQLRFPKNNEAEQLWSALGGKDILIEYWISLQKHNDQDSFWNPNAHHQYTSSESDAAWEKMHKSDILPICRNPLMLSMVCDLFRYEKLLPENRGKLFERFIEVCIDNEFVHQTSLHNRLINSITKNDVLSVLSTIASNIHERKLGTGILLSECTDLLSNSWKSNLINSCIKLSRNAGIIRIENDQVRFSHQLIQEYFAGESMKNAMYSIPQVPASRFFPQHNWWEPQGWEETAVILAGTLDLQSFNQFIKWLAVAQPSLTIRCIERCGIPNVSITSINKELRTFLQDTWTPRIYDKNEPFESKTIIGEMLGLIGDPRKGVLCSRNDIGTSYPDFSWCPTKMDSILVSTYCVTNDQFNAFICASNGYNCDEWWDISEESFQWHIQNMNPQKTPSSIANLPRINVCWFEAIAFCRWCSSVLSNQIDLPSVEEWQSLCLNNRHFPWGNEYINGYANTSYESHKAITTVGLFSMYSESDQPQDLVGNVWEWTKDVFNMTNGTDITGITKSTRILKGGSWQYSPEYALKNYLFYAFPNLRRDDIGFRVVKRCN